KPRKQRWMGKCLCQAPCISTIQGFRAVVISISWRQSRISAVTDLPSSDAKRDSSQEGFRFFFFATHNKAGPSGPASAPQLHFLDHFLQIHPFICKRILDSNRYSRDDFAG